MAIRAASCSCDQLTAQVVGEPVRVSICHCLGFQRGTDSNRVRSCIDTSGFASLGRPPLLEGVYRPGHWPIERAVVLQIVSHRLYFFGAPD
jgi:hypothetical protein